MMISEKKLNRIRTSGSVGMVLSVSHTLFWILVVILSFFAISEGADVSTGIDVIVFSLICIALGVLWFCKSRNSYNIRKLCVRYTDVLREYPSMTIAGLASILDEQEKTTRKNINYLISKRCVEGIRYTFQGDFVTVDQLSEAAPQPEHEQIIAYPDYQESRVAIPQKKESVVCIPVTCKACCGITMLPPDSKGVCDYCGSKIKS